LQTSSSQTVQVYTPITITSFTIAPPRLVLYVAQSVTLSWNAPGALNTSVTGLEGFTDTPLDAAYGESATISLVGIPRAPMTLTLYAQNTDTSAQQQLTVELISPQCNATSGDAALRASPNATDQVVATIPLGTTVVVDAQDPSGQWLRVQLPGGAHGWGERSAFTCASTFSVDDLYRETNVPTPRPQLTIVPTLSTAIAPTTTPQAGFVTPTRVPATIPPLPSPTLPQPTPTFAG